jgi:hypothetical protein
VRRELRAQAVARLRLQSPRVWPRRQEPRRPLPAASPALCRTHIARRRPRGRCAPQPAGRPARRNERTRRMGAMQLADPPVRRAGGCLAARRAARPAELQPHTCTSAPTNLLHGHQRLSRVGSPEHLAAVVPHRHHAPIQQRDQQSRFRAVVLECMKRAHRCERSLMARLQRVSCEKAASLTSMLKRVHNMRLMAWLSWREDGLLAAGRGAQPRLGSCSLLRTCPLRQRR